ncbi:Tetraspanin-2 [Zea mays]|uniref:Tetraspanin-2 n=1 Tax=Zea mays TaxID=4577 RepID=A0A1D6H6Y8_MAIZE|nr:Tetraspanin-2 [Zea mays]
MRDAAGADLRGARDRVGGVVRVGAGRGVRAPGAVARGHPGRAAPAGRAGGLRGRGLRAVEQRPGAAVLRVRVLQGGPPGGAPGPVAQGQRRPRRRHRRPRHPLPRRLQRLQERAGRRHLRTPQVLAS